jgi:uncharacterized repeat protein (TIGR01451 family)
VKKNFDFTRGFVSIRYRVGYPFFMHRGILFLLICLLSTANALALPRITSISPIVGGPGTQVTIQGQQLGGIVEVVFGNAKANILQRGANGLLVVVPLDATSAPIYVYDQVRNFDYTLISFQVTPRISGFTPTRGVLGEEVIINGFNLSNINNLDLAPLVYFNGVLAQVFVGGDTQLTAKVPPGATTGPITVETLASYHTSPALFYLPPIIQSFSPARAKVGEVLTLKGINFIGASLVRIGGATATILSAQLQEATVIVPAGALDGTLFIETPGGAFFSDPASPFLLLPKIESFDPPGGAIGSVISINGTGLAKATQAYFGDKAAAISEKSALLAKCTVPLGATSGPISIVTSNGTNTSSAVFYISPSISLISPTRGQTGAVVTVTGLNLLGANKVEFGGIATPEFTIVDNTRLTARVPYGALNGGIRITNPGGNVLSSQSFEIVGDEPVISSFTPAFGNPGTQITITGLNFLDATNVTFNGVSATPTVNGANSLVVSVPPGATTGPLKVFTPKGSGTSAQEFTLGDSADLKLTLGATPLPPVAGGRLVYTIDVKNDGPLDATAVVINFAIPKESDYITASVSRGTLEKLGSGVINSVGKLSAGATATLLVMVKPKAEGTITAAAQVSSDTPDTNPLNSSAKLILQAAPLTLKLDAVANGFVRLSWPDAVTNFVLETSSNLKGLVWDPVTNAPLNIGNEYRVAVPFAPEEGHFFRLKQTP